MGPLLSRQGTTRKIQAGDQSHPLVMLARDAGDKLYNAFVSACDAGTYLKCLIASIVYGQTDSHLRSVSMFSGIVTVTGRPERGASATEPVRRNVLYNFVTLRREGTGRFGKRA